MPSSSSLFHFVGAKMKGCLYFLALVATCRAVFFHHGPARREIRIEGDRRIFMRQGDKMVIFTIPRDDPKCMEIVIKKPAGMVKVVKINRDNQILKDISISNDRGIEEERVEDSRSYGRKPYSERFDNPQMKVLMNICKKYEGNPGEGALYQLLKEVKQHVDNRELHPFVYEAISELEVAANEEENSTEGYAKETSKEYKRNVEPSGEQKAKISQVVQAARQIEWIQNLLKNKRHQDPEVTQESRSDRDFNSRREATTIKNSIYDLQKEITQRELEFQQLQAQQQFLSQQIYELEMWQRMKHGQGGYSSEMHELRLVLEEVSRKEMAIVEKMVSVGQVIRQLQDQLLKKQEELKDNLRKEVGI